MKPIDRQQLRKVIEAMPEGGKQLVILRRRWLEQVERELQAGAAALQEVAALRANREVQT